MYTHRSGTPGVRISCKSLPAKGCCAVSPTLSQGWVTSRSPTSGPTLTHVPYDAQIAVPPVESKPKTKEGLGKHCAPTVTPGVTCGTQLAESQNADA
jgi:hypothetical protein